jgi:hypothetical protein
MARTYETSRKVFSSKMIAIMLSNQVNIVPKIPARVSMLCPMCCISLVNNADD